MERFPRCICGQDRYKVVYDEEWKDREGKLNFSILQCPNCGLLRNFPIPQKTTSTMADIGHRLENLELWESFGQNLIRLISKFQEKGKLKVLDIGSNIGVFVNLAKKNGWQAIGIDLDKKRVEVGRKKFNIDLRCTDLVGAKFENNEFDVVVLSHTLEHIFEPEKLLQEIRRVLNEMGILVIEVPNIEGLPVKIQKIRRQNWYGYDPRQHLWHFTPKTIHNLLEKHGFRILELKTSKPLYYEKTGSFLDIPRDLILKLSGFLGMVDQITLVATPQK